MMSSKFKLIVYYDTNYTLPFLVKIGSPIVCFHPIRKIQYMGIKNSLSKYKIENYFHLLFKNRCNNKYVQNTIFWPKCFLFSGFVVQGRYLQNWSIIDKTWNPNIHILKPLSRVHNNLHLNVVTFWFEGIKVSYKNLGLWLLHMNLHCIYGAMD
jgi:hypothetical protein